MIRSATFNQRTAALMMLVMFAGCSGADRVATLIAQLKEPDADRRIAAAEELREAGPEAHTAVPALVEALRDLHPGVRQAAARALGEMADDAHPAIESLEGALEDAELTVQLAAAWALVKIDPAGRKYVPVLTRTMQAGEGGTMVAVGNLGTAAEWAVPTLTALLQDQRPGVRRLAAEALGKIGPTGDAKAALEQATHDADDRVRAAAERALGRR